MKNKEIICLIERGKLAITSSSLTQNFMLLTLVSLTHFHLLLLLLKKLSIINNRISFYKYQLQIGPMIYRALNIVSNAD